MDLDPVCLMHGKRQSENPPHWAGRCLYCCLCFKVLMDTADCNSLPDGSYEDVCVDCANQESVRQSISKGEADK